MDIKINTLEMKNGHQTATAVWVDGKHFIPARGPMITREMWDKLARAEEALYRGEFGCHSYTDVMVFDELDDFLGQIWFQAQIALESSVEHWDELTSNTQMSLIARRVAQVFALMNFGAEFLLK